MARDTLWIFFTLQTFFVHRTSVCLFVNYAHKLTYNHDEFSNFGISSSYQENFFDYQSSSITDAVTLTSRTAKFSENCVWCSGKNRTYLKAYKSNLQTWIYSRVKYTFLEPVTHSQKHTAITFERSTRDAVKVLNLNTLHQ